MLYVPAQVLAALVLLDPGILKVVIRASPRDAGGWVTATDGDLSAALAVDRLLQDTLCFVI